ncbi:M20 family metallopeptidase [Martelella alba]|uniref:M20 family metallopeptidase n=1 Tax=Martelella alba TaxID=2590451 RepID=A0A506TZ07_9HYPH|nr:M20 family metallopeptidase [Martelella alba]TPW27333.1 M20 family metallopeptidase [Martelella alba]
MDQLSPDASAALAQIDRDELVGLACDMIRVPSVKGDEATLVRKMAAWFEERGYEVWLQELDHGLCSVIATLKGTGGGKSLMFNGHLDTDPVTTFGWSRDPFEPFVDGNKLYGAGVINMKGPDASFVHAAEAIRKSGVKLKGDLVVTLVCGELQGGYGTDQLMKSGFRTDMAICCEPFGTWNVLTMNVGVSSIAISVKGKTEHIMYKKNGVDAIQKMLKVIPAIDATEFTYEPRADLPDVPAVHVGAIIGGRGDNYNLKGPNYVSDYCTILCDIRFLPGQTIDSVVADFERALEKVKAEDPELDYKIEVPAPAFFSTGLTRGHEPFEISPDEYIVKTVVKYRTEVMGEPPELVGVHNPGSYSGDDTSHLWKAGIPCVLFGPGHPNGIKSAFADEFMDIDDMVAHSKILTLTALEVCNLDK